MKKKKNDVAEEYTKRASLHLLFSVISLCNLFAMIIVSGLLAMFFKKFGIVRTLDELVGAKFATTALFLLSSIVIGWVVSLFIVKMPLIPFNGIINAHNKLAKGKFDTRLSFGKFAGKNKYMRELADSFNTMAEELGNTEMLRSDFINNFSHEFKTPIVSIAGFAELLKNGNLTEEQKTEYLNVIQEESLRLSKMATNVLNLTKIENQNILTDISEFNLTEQVRNCLLLFENKWNEKNLEVDFDGDEFNIKANEELLKQVWINLIDNAVKYADEYGEIGVSIEKNSSEIKVSVMNTGTTIPEESIDKIFLKFYQADVSHSSNGNGIGLAIVKKIVELHKGGIEVKSENNKTVFTVNLPVT